MTDVIDIFSRHDAMLEAQKDSSPLSENLKRPDNAAEKIICKSTLLGSFLFIGTALYFLFAPMGDALALKLLIGGMGIFTLALAVFLLSAFSGLLCGCDGKQGRTIERN